MEFLLSFSESDCTLHTYYLVQHAFTGEEHAIDLAPHGNCKTSSRGFVRTLESTKKELVKVSYFSKPKETFHTVLQSEGNCHLSEIRSVGAIPKSREQGSKLLKHKESMCNNVQKNISHACSEPFRGLASKDPWYNLLLECKKQGKNVTFIRDVKLAPEPSCVLATDRQLHDLARFCCNPFQYSPLTVDPTFNLGQYNVTIVTYKHLMLKNRRGGGNPCLVGPVMIHSRKTRESYSQLCSTMKTLEPSLKNLLAFGTDEEKALIDAFENNFDSAVHVLCTRHLRNTCKTHLRRLGMPETIQEEMLNDVFGATWGGIEQKGIIDASNEAEFYEMCDRMGEKWAMKHPAGLEAFRWFKENKAKVLVEKAIAPVRRQAGLGDPPGKFYTNQSESNNHLVQSFVQEDAGSKKVDEYVFCKTLDKLVRRQTVDIELAVTNRGPYEICDDYNALLISEDKWVKMTPKQRTSATGKVHSISLSESNVKESLTTRVDRHQQTSLENKLFQFGVDWIPSDVLQGMSNKAENMLLEGSNLVVAPGSQRTLVVPSQSCPQIPRLVQQQASGRIICSCAQYTSMSICSHALVYAQYFDIFPSYLKWLKCQRRRKGGDSINISNLANHGMPAGRGRKGGRLPTKKGKCTSATSTQLNQSPLYATSSSPRAVSIDSVLHQGQSPVVGVGSVLNQGQSPVVGVDSVLNQGQSPVAGVDSVLNQGLQSKGVVDVDPVLNQGQRRVAGLGQSPMTGVNSFLLHQGQSTVAGVNSFLHQGQSTVAGVNSSLNQGQSPVGLMSLQTQNNNFMVQQSSPSAASHILPLSPLSGMGSMMALQWHSGMSAHRYELQPLPKNVQKCYGCGKQFTEKYRRAPHNVIIKHVDRRIRGKDTMGNITVSNDFTATYYHLDSKHVKRKNPLFNKVVYVTNSLFLELDVEQLGYIHEGNLII